MPDSGWVGCACSLGVWSWGVPAPGGSGLRGGSGPRGVPAPGGGGVWRPPMTATAAGGTHPTGMHSYDCNCTFSCMLDTKDWTQRNCKLPTKQLHKYLRDAKLYCHY